MFRGWWGSMRLTQLLINLVRERWEHNVYVPAASEAVSELALILKICSESNSY